MARRRKKLTLPDEPFTVSIDKLSHEGRGIAEHNKQKVFVFAALPGEIVECRYTHIKKQYAQANVITLKQAANHRVEPRCPHFTLCGGCSLQHLDTQAQINHKQTVLLEQLQHFGNIQTTEILPPLVGNSWGYRHKARLGVRFVAKKQSVLVGFRERGNTFLADMKECHILPSPVGQLIKPLRELIANLNVYQHIAQIEVAIGDDQTALVFRHLVELDQADQNQLIEFAQQYQLSIYLQAGGPATVKKLFPQDEQFYLHYSLPDYDLQFKFHPLDFTQVNPMMNQKMVKHAMDLLDLKSTDRVLDLFCGLGNFSLAIARQAQQVLGIEGSRNMVERAHMNAQHNNINNAEFEQMDLTQAIHDQVWAQISYDKILLDPPRSGASELLEVISQFNAERIVYISCHPASFACDAGQLSQLGYTLIKVGVMDMFPHTAHTESIGLFIKNTNKIE